MSYQQIPVPPERSGMELDEFLCLSFPLLSKGYLRRQVREGRILVDGNPAVPSQRLRLDQVLVIDLDLDLDDEDAPEARPPPSAVPLDVLYEDDDVIAIDKPARLPVEPDRWRKDEPHLLEALVALAIERSRPPCAAHDGTAAARDEVDPVRAHEGLPFRPRLVHRIDKDTTGVVLIAKSLAAERRLQAAFEAGAVHKHYLALVEGEHPLVDGATDVIDLPVAPDARRSGRMRVHAEGKPARTRIAVASRFRGYTLLDCEPLTGRTHQIRVHLREIGFPLAVDPVYGRRTSLSLSEIKRGYRAKPGHAESPLIERLTLHARSVDFPAGDANGSEIHVEAPIPRDLSRLLKQLAKVRAHGS